MTRRAHRASTLAVGAMLLVACGGAEPTPTGTVCPTPDPLTQTWDNIGQPFMDRYCVQCHASTLTRAQRNGAPIYHDFDSLLGVLRVAGHVDQYAGFGPDAHNTIMPPARCPSVPGGPIAQDCPQPTAAERTALSEWLACEIDRSHDFTDAGTTDAGSAADAGVD